MNVLVTGMELSIVVSGRVEGKTVSVSQSKHACNCVQCGVGANLGLEAGFFFFALCPEDAIKLALELVREVKAAMQEEKKRSVVR